MKTLNPTSSLLSFASRFFLLTLSSVTAHAACLPTSEQIFSADLSIGYVVPKRQGNMEHDMYSWNISSGQIEKQFVGHAWPGSYAHLDSISISADGKRLAGSSSASDVIVWDPATGKRLLAWETDQHDGVIGDYEVAGNHIAFNSHDRYSHNSIFYIVDINSKKIIYSIKGNYGVNFTLSPDGSVLYTYTENGLSRIDLKSGTSIQIPFYVQFGPTKLLIKNGFLYAANNGDITKFDLDLLTRLYKVDLPYDEVTDFEISVEKNLVKFNNYEVKDLETGNLLFRVPKFDVLSSQLSADGSKFSVSRQDGWVDMYDTSTWKLASRSCIGM